MRVIAHIDLDCFYVQVVQRMQPTLFGKPVAVTQYAGGAQRKPVIAMSYEAKSMGVKRNMTAVEAKKRCPGKFKKQLRPNRN
jgi:DNA polymerase eta